MFNEKHWKDDIIAGFIIFLIALPLSIGIALAANAPASAGILAAIFGGIIGTFFTGSHIVINGPAAGLIVVILGAITSLSDGDPMVGFKRMLACTAVAGALQIVCGLFRWGRFAFMAPSAVVHGMLSAIGCIILIKQFPVILGVKPNSPHILEILAGFPRIITETDVPIAAIGLSSLILLVLLNKFGGKLKSILPGPLQAVIVGLFFSVSMGLAHAHDIKIFDISYHVGPEFLVKVPTNFMQMFIFPSFDDIGSTRSLIAILTIFIVCSLESLLSSYAVDKLDPYRRKSNLDRDFIGKGITNLCCGVFGAYPIISEIVRSSANIDNGAKTKWSNFFHGAFILLFVALVPNLINQIPLASLAAVLMIVGFNLAHPKHFKAVYHHGADQLLFFLTTLIVTISVDLLAGIAAGIALKFIIHLIRGVPLHAFFSPKINVKEEANNIVIEFGSPVVFLGFLKVQKIFKDHPGKKFKVVDNGYFVDFTIRELVRDSIHDAVDSAQAARV